MDERKRDVIDAIVELLKEADISTLKEILYYIAHRI